jgi:hypothetical protein
MHVNRAEPCQSLTFLELTVADAKVFPSFLPYTFRLPTTHLQIPLLDPEGFQYQSILATRSAHMRLWRLFE